MTYSSTVLGDSPAAYWRLGEASGTNMADSSGNGRNGTYSSGIGPGYGTTGLLVGDSDTSITFNGATWADVAYAAWMDSATALTVEAWIKPSTVSGVQAIHDRDASSSARVYQYRLNGNKLEFVKIGGTGGVVTAQSVTSFVAGTAYYIVVTYDGSNIRLYINGTLDKTQAAAGDLGTAAASFRLAASFAGTTTRQNFFNGVIDEAAVYNSVLSATQITAHYNAGMNNSGPPLAIAVPLAAYASAHSLAPSWNEIVSGGTDTSNAMSGRSRGGLSTGSVTRPVATVPAALVTAQKYDKTAAYPTPTMVNGRPT